MRIEGGIRYATVTDDAIKGFFGEYRYLSNFHLSPILLDGRSYPSAEHAYMALKSLDPQVQQSIAELPTPAAARKKGQLIDIRPDWEQVKLSAMLRVLMVKFQEPSLQAALLSTGAKQLEEANNWGDRYWGVDGHGCNFLGQLLMLVRAHYANSKAQVAPESAQLKLL